MSPAADTIFPIVLFFLPIETPRLPTARFVRPLII